MRLPLPALLVALFLAGPFAAAAQEPPDAPAVQGEKTDGDAAATARPPTSNAAYMAPLSRLSSILGSVHFLRTLCGDSEAGIWRQKMSDLLAAQAPSEADRRQLVASFNSGYRAFEATYRRCTPAARLAVARYQTEGATLSREISTRFGN